MTMKKSVDSDVKDVYDEDMKQLDNKDEIPNIIDSGPIHATVNRMWLVCEKANG